MAYTEKAMPVGGLTEEKLGLATATTADVLNGKTFYSGDNELKTGVLVAAEILLNSYKKEGEYSESVTFSKNYKKVYAIVSGSDGGSYAACIASASYSGNGTTNVFRNTELSCSTSEIKTYGLEITNVSKGEKVTVAGRWNATGIVIGVGGYE